MNLKDELKSLRPKLLASVAPADRERAKQLASDEGDGVDVYDSTDELFVAIAAVLRPGDVVWYDWKRLAVVDDGSCTLVSASRLTD
jgi:hypothetical protein